MVTPIANSDQATDSASTDEVAFLSEARELYEYDLQCDTEDRKAAEDDNVFANASDTGTEQWDEVALSMRRIPGAERPVQQWNRIPTYIQQIVNDGRQNKPSIKIAPADGGTKETADYFQDRIRHIEYQSNADIAYDTARDQQVTSGRGFVRVDTEYVPGTFKQRACVLPIDNQFSVVWDAASIKYDMSDAEHCFVISYISQAKHKRDYPNSEIVNNLDFVRDQNPAPKWIGVGSKNELIQIAEYWKKQYRKRKLCMLPGDVPVWKDDLSAEQYATFKKNGQILGERDDQYGEVFQYVINGVEILKKTKWIGTTIPIVPLWGRIAVVGGQRHTFSLIRNAKDPQRLVNLYVSNIAEQIAMMPKTPYIAAIGSIAPNHEDDWQNAQNTSKGFLYWIEYGPDGKTFSRPERVVNEPPIQALSVGLQQAIEGIKSAMGIYDASLGARSNETSGVAIDQRRKSADVLNFHFADNEARSRKRVGQILVEIIPILDKPGTTQTAQKKDGQTYEVPIGTPYQHPDTGEMVTHVLTDGDYGVNVSTGPSFQSQREQAFQRDSELIKYDPALMWVFGDQMFASDDTAGSDERAARMRKAIMMKTPGLIEDPKQQLPIPPQVQQEIMQLQQKLQTTDAFAQSLHQQIATKQPELDNQVKIKQMEIDSKNQELTVEQSLKKYTVDEQEKTKRTLGLATIDQKDAIAYLTQELNSLNQKHDRLHERMMQQTELEHKAQQATQQQQAQADQADQAQQSQADQQDSQQEHEAGQNDADREAAQEQAETAAQQQGESEAPAEGAE